MFFNPVGGASVLATQLSVYAVGTVVPIRQFGIVPARIVAVSTRDICGELLLMDGSVLLAMETNLDGIGLHILPMKDNKSIIQTKS